MLDAVRVAVGAAALVFALSLSPPVLAQADNLVVAGQRIGPVQLNATDADLYRLLGDPASSWEDKYNIMFTYPTLVVTVDKASNRIVVISTRSPQYSTPDGIKVGTSKLAVSVKLGLPGTCQGNNCQFFYDSGLILTTDGNGAVKALGIRLPGDHQSRVSFVFSGGPD